MKKIIYFILVFVKDLVAGPLINFPSKENLDPWQGQSQVLS